jgi:hypothetical protein
VDARRARLACALEIAMNFMKTIVAAGLVTASASAFAADITGAGATFRSRSIRNGRMRTGRKPATV